MKGFLLFIFLLSLAMCQHSDTHYGTTEERIQRRKKIQKEICECLLKEDISSELKSKLEENKDQDLRHTLHLFMNKENSKDKEIIRKCRREVFGKMRDLFKNRKFYGFLNRTKYRHFPFLHDRLRMNSTHEVTEEKKSENSTVSSAKSSPFPSAKNSTATPSTSAKKSSAAPSTSAKKSSATPSTSAKKSSAAPSTSAKKSSATPSASAKKSTTN
jgi:hypothetical protein